MKRTRIGFYRRAITGSEPFIFSDAERKRHGDAVSPRKSGFTGLKIFDQFLSGGKSEMETSSALPSSASSAAVRKGLAKRVIACLDVA